MLTPDRLVHEVEALLSDPAGLKQMGERARGIAVIDAAERIVTLLAELL
jgi:UDP-N-acetylglucosamine:LPS N-acetylglucosamine transferase